TIALNEGEEVTCTYANHHTVNSPTIATLLSDDSITVGGTIHDSSTLSGATSDAGGTVKYRYYSTLAACNDAANTYASPGGTSAGDKTVTAGVVPNSDDATFNSAGTFYWRAWYSGDSNNSGASSACADEALVVGKASPTIATDAGGPYRIDKDGTVDLTDKATLSGGTGDAGGVINFTLYGPDPTPNSNPEDDCSGVPAGTATASVTGGANDATYTSTAVTVTEPGTYHW